MRPQQWSPRLRGVYDAVRATSRAGVASVAVVCPAADGAVEGGRRAVVEGEVCIRVPALGFFKGVSELAELALKLTVNAVSAGAHIMKGEWRRVAAARRTCAPLTRVVSAAGTVYGNRMINVTISNFKLVQRAIDIVARVAGVSTGEGASLCVWGGGRLARDDCVLALQPETRF